MVMAGLPVEELIVPLLACAAILYASVWYLQSRRLNKNTNKKAMPKGKKEALPSQPDPNPREEPVPPTQSNIWVVEKTPESTETTPPVYFAGQRLALLYCSLCNSNLLVQKCKSLSTNTNSWPDVWLKKCQEQKILSPPAPFSLPQALKYHKRKLIDLCNTLLQANTVVRKM